MARQRDSQRSRVYEWERAAVRLLLGRSINMPEYDTIEDCNVFMFPIWSAERGRVGRARVLAPLLDPAGFGRRSAIAYNYDTLQRDGRRGGGLIKLPRWARSRWVILHEMAHRLINDRSSDPGHGPRFVGCLIGLAARHLDLDAARLMELADEHGVAYHVRTIGVVPLWTPVHHVRQALHSLRPMSAMDLACDLAIRFRVDITARQVRGAALFLISRGEARWLRGKLVPIVAREDSAESRVYQWQRNGILEAAWA